VVEESSAKTIEPPALYRRTFNFLVLPGSRLKEIAVRKAIGAQQQDILRSVLGKGGRR
jgi:hypothetical protein